MARAVIVTDFLMNSDGQSGNVTVVMWLTAPVTRQRPLPTFVSAVPPASLVPWGVTQAELQALRLGQIVEVGYTSTNQTTVNGAQADVQNAYASQQAALTITGFTTNYIGASWDGQVADAWILPPNPAMFI